MPGRPKSRARKAAAAALAAQPPKPAPSIADALRRLPTDWIAHHTARARIVVGLCLEEMHVRLADPAARAQIPLRDLAQAANARKPPPRSWPPKPGSDQDSPPSQAQRPPMRQSILMP